MSVSNKLSQRVILAQKGRKKCDFARELGISRQVLYRIEKGIISPHSIKVLARYFNMTITEVLDEYHKQI